MDTWVYKMSINIYVKFDNILCVIWQILACSNKVSNCQHLNLYARVFACRHISSTTANGSSPDELSMNLFINDNFRFLMRLASSGYPTSSKHKMFICCIPHPQ